MLDKNYLLDDKQMRDFIINGYVTVQTDFAPDFHESIYRKAEGVFEKEGNPGNNIMARVPELHQVFNHPVVRGVLTSTLGPSYIMHPHRHCHFNPPGSEGQAFHQDSYEADENVRHHRSRWAMVFYYPQDVTEDIGPTAILPATQYYNTRTGAHSQSELPLCGKAGTVTIVHYDLWHRAMANRSDSKRFMMKFLFCRMEEPQAPSWNADAPGGLSFDNGSSALQHQVMWRHLWDWMSGKQGNGVKAANPSSNSDVPKWIKAMRAGDEAARCDAADALGVMGESAQDTVPALIEALQDESEAVRLNAAYALGAIGEPAVPALISALHKEAEKSLEQNLDRSHANPSQLYSVYALSAVGQPAVPTLIDILSDENWWVRAAAADTLGDIGTAAKVALPALTKALRDESAWVRRNATEALGTLGPAAKTAIPALAELLTDEHDWVRHNAASALARMGRVAEAAVPTLIKALGDETRYVRGNAAEALKQIGTPEAQNVLSDFLFASRWCPLS